MSRIRFNRQFYIEFTTDMPFTKHITRLSRFQDIWQWATHFLVFLLLLLNIRDNTSPFMTPEITHTSQTKGILKDTFSGHSLSTTENLQYSLLIEHMTIILMAPELDLSCLNPQVNFILILGHFMYASSLARNLSVEVKKNFKKGT